MFRTNRLLPWMLAACAIMNAAQTSGAQSTVGLEPPAEGNSGRGAPTGVRSKIFVSYGSKIAAVRVITVDTHPSGWTNGNPPVAKVELLANYVGEIPVAFKASWRPPAPGYCGSQDAENKRLWTQWEQAPFPVALTPKPGDKLLVSLSKTNYRGAKTEWSVESQVPLTAESQNAIETEVKRLQAQRSAQNARWDSVDFSALQSQATDIIVGKTLSHRNGYEKPKYGGNVIVSKRLKDSAGSIGRTVERPVFSAISWPSDGPFADGFIAFLKIRKTSIGWNPPPGWPAVTVNPKNDQELYSRIVFQYDPVDSDYFVIPYSVMREKQVMQAVTKSPQSSRSQLWQDKAFKMLQLQQESYNISSDQLEPIAKESFSLAQQIFDRPIDGAGLARGAQIMERFLRRTGKKTEAEELHKQMTEVNRVALGLQQRSSDSLMPEHTKFKDWWALDYQP